MRKLVVGVAAFVWFAGAAAAQDNLAANFFGNTLTVTTPEGATRLWYNADRTFTGQDASGAQVAGTWDINGSQFCSHMEGRPPQCGELERAYNVGEQWRSTRPDGVVVELALSAGRS